MAMTVVKAGFQCSAQLIVTNWKGQVMTHIRNRHHFLCHNVVQDEGEGHLIVIIQQGVDGLLQPHQPVLLLHTQKDKTVNQAGGCFIKPNSQVNTDLLQFIITQVQHGLSHLCYWMFCTWLNKTRFMIKPLSDIKIEYSLKSNTLQQPYHYRWHCFWQ